MKRFLCWLTVCYCCGIFLGEFFSLEQCFGIFLTFILAILMKIFFTKDTSFPIVVMVIAVITGLCYFKAYSDAAYNPVAEYIGKPAQYTCRVIEAPVEKDGKVQYTVKLEEITVEGQSYKSGAKVKLTSPMDEKSKAYRYGDLLNVRSKLQLPGEAMNPGGFDYNSYLRGKDIFATSFAQDYQIHLMESGKGVSPFSDFTYNIKMSALGTVDRFITGEEGALLKGILVGERNDFSDRMTEDFSKSGLTHLVAVSGSHVAILIAGIAYLLGLLRLNRYIIHIISILVIIQFVFLTGCTPSIVRAGIMGIVFLAAFMIQRETDGVTTLFFSALLMLVYNPITFFDAGFQLSFGATLGLIVFYQPIDGKLGRIPGFLRPLVAASAAAQMGTIPITAYHFNGLSIIALISNLPAVPLSSVLLISGLFLWFMGMIHGVLGTVAAGFNFVLLKMLLLIAKFFAWIPFSVISVPSPGFFSICAYILAVFILYRILKGKKDIWYKYACFALILTVVSAVSAHWLSGNRLEVTFVNVGQGDCTLLTGPAGKTMLVDGGGAAEESNFDVGNDIVVPYLYKRGIMKLDAVMVSHYHDDHAKGILTLLEAMPVRTLLLPMCEDENQLHGKLVKAAEKAGVEIAYLTAKDKIKFDEKLQMEILSPEVAPAAKTGYNENDRSIVMKVIYGKVSLLLTGDAEKVIEERLLKQGEDLKSDILKVGHHGSDTSSTDSFVNAVAPQYAIFHVGKNNFGHPNPGVLKRFEDMNAHILRTDLNGTITFSVDGQKIKSVKVFKE